MRIYDEDGLMHATGEVEIRRADRDVLIEGEAYQVRLTYREVQKALEAFEDNGQMALPLQIDRGF